MKNYPTTLLRVLLLLCTLLPAALRGTAQNAESLTDGAYYRIVCGGTSEVCQANPYLWDNAGTLCAQALASSDAQQWQVKAVSGKDGYYTVRNKATGRYLQPITSNETQVFTSATETQVYLSKNSKTGSSQTWFNILSSASSKVSYNWRNAGEIKGWAPNDGKRSGLTNSEWGFVAVAAGDLDALLSSGKVRIKTRRSNGYYITNIDSESGDLVMRADLSASGEESFRQIWIVEKHGDGYSLRNYKTGKYLAYKQAATSPETFKIAYNEDNASGESYVNIYKSIAASSGAVHYQVYGDLVVEWGAADSPGSDWTFEGVDLTDAEVLAHFDGLAGNLSEPATDKWILIRNTNGCVLSENTTTANEEVNDRDKSNFAQLWKLVAVKGKSGHYQLQNALTEKYVGFASYNVQHTSTSSAPSGGFIVSRNTDWSRFCSAYEMRPSNNSSYALHRSSSRLLTWNAYTSTSDTEGSVWFFEDAGVTDAQVQAARDAYSGNTSETENADAYYKALNSFFSDDACTELRLTWKTKTDDALREAMASAGIKSAALQDMAVKIKNNAWDKWEKTFRVRDVEPYSDPTTWDNILKIGYLYTKLSNPTGIWVSTNGLAYVFVGGDIPSGCTLELLQVDKTDSQGDAVTLKKGLNIVAAAKDAALYLAYTVPTTADAGSKKIADFANIPVHIEGGEVDGYFDATREGIDTDEAWQQMVKDGLFSKGMAMMKGRNIVYQLNSKLVRQYIPVKMREIVDFWDWMVDVEHSIMAVDEYKDRWHNVLGFYSVDHSYMYATNFGTYYNESTLSEVLVYDKMCEGGGSLWGPAHENGHIHQRLLNMIGTTEISNNLFSQVVVHENGKTSTRLNGTTLRDAATAYADGKSWHDYNMWVRNTMFFKLYLYYHVQGYKKDFYPELFRALRKDPMSRATGSASSPTPASEDFLKFAVKCCEVSGDDLSEFFRAFGFFVPFETRQIDDYSTFYTRCTQAMVDEALAKMKQYPKPKGNILFIENHIKHEPATDHDGNPTGQLRTDYNEEDAVGKCGDVGSYSDFADGHYASGYSYTLIGNVVSVTGSGAVGFKVYDKEGNLLYFANTNTFTLPTSVTQKLSGTTMVLKAAQGDGTDVLIPAPGTATCLLKVYRASSASADKCVQLYSDGSEETLPTLTGNDLVFASALSGKTMPASLLSRTNYVDAAKATAANVVLTDEAAFCSPSAFTASRLTYTRAANSGWNAVCLPFAVSASDFGSGAKLEWLEYVDGTTLHFGYTSKQNEAGRPCLVYSPNASTWTLSKTGATVCASAAVENKSGAQLVGAFSPCTLPEGGYLLDGGTDRFVLSEGATAAPFRCYFVQSSNGRTPSSLSVQHAAWTGLSAVPAAADSQAVETWYDLSGRRVAVPVKGGVYIVNGRKVVR